ALIDLSMAFEYGQGYVALSRVRTLEGLTLLGFNTRALAVHPTILARDEEFRDDSAAAREAFSALPEEERKIMEGRFVRACGGTEESEGKTITRSKPKTKASTVEVTFGFVQEGRSLEEIAQERGLTIGTVVDH